MGRSSIQASSLVKVTSTGFSANCRRRSARIFQMRGISFVNELHGEEEESAPTGSVVSGAGGQYSFVAQAFALEGARSIIMLNATLWTRGRRESRLVVLRAALALDAWSDIEVREHGAWIGPLLVVALLRQESLASNHLACRHHGAQKSRASAGGREVALIGCSPSSTRSARRQPPAWRA